ncbi:MAG: protein kinase domain-containing protein [bacterium]
MKEFQPVRFGKYLLLDRIGAGGMAELYRAKIIGDEGFEKLIAIKKILPHLTVEKSLIESFIHEAKLAAMLQHQNIVQIYDFGNLEGFYFIAMEYLFGKDLRSILIKSEKKGLPFSLENALYIASGMCSGLHYAHNLKDFHGNPLNIIHRDIGPHNIFITYDGHVKIIDFGIAKTALQETVTQTGSIKGKIGYMSPEQALGEHIDYRSDIFSLGIVLYEMVTQKGIFEGKNIFEAYAKAREGNFNPPDEIKKDMEPRVYAILCKALATKPENRYQSADEMHADLDICISELSLQPNDRCLSQYIKSLFEDEADSEETELRKAALINHNDTSHSQEDTEVTKIFAQDTIVKKLKLQRHVTVPLITVLIACVTIVCIMFIKNRFFRIDDDKPVFAHRDFTEDEDSGTEYIPTESEYNAFMEAHELLESKQFAQAIALFEDILVNNHSMKGKIGVPFSRALQGEASSIMKEDPDKAETLLHKSILLDPNSANAHFLLGRLYMIQKNNTKAIESYKKAVEIDPQMPKALFNLGYMSAKNKDYTKAEEMYERVIALSPEFVDEALFNLGLMHAKLGETEQGIEYLRKAVRANPENKHAKDLLARLKKKNKQ